MNKVADHIDDQAALDACRQEARALIEKFPLYDEAYNDYFE